MKVHVVYHRADFDGLFSGAVCWHWLREKLDREVTMQGWDFGDPPAVVPEGTRQLYVIDLPPDCTEPGYQGEFFWIDHHKSSIEKFRDGFHGFRIDGVAACRLAWQWFRVMYAGSLPRTLPEKIDFVERLVDEPVALRLAGEYDVWDKRDPDPDQFQFGLYCRDDWSPQELAEKFFDHPDATGLCTKMIVEGHAIMGWQRVFARQVCKSRGYYVDLGGNRYWALASVHARNSMWFPNDAVPEDCNGLLCYRIEGDGLVKVSLYNREGCEEIDHSVIAVAHGGGGHKGACGFQMTLGQAVLEGIVR